MFSHQNPSHGFSFFALTIFLLLQSPTAEATDARAVALGGGHFLEDERSVLRWYGSLPNFGNVIFLESGHYDFSDRNTTVMVSRSDYGGGLHLNLGTNGKFGTAALFYNEEMRDGYISTSVEDDPGNSLTWMYAKRLGALQIGVSLRHAHKQYTRPTYFWGGGPILHYELSRTVIGVGIHADLSSDNYLEAAVDLQNVDWDDLPDFYTDEHFDPWSNLTLRLRASFALNRTMALKPVLEFWNENYLGHVPGPVNMYPYRNKMGRLGCGLKIAPSDGRFILLSADYSLSLMDEDDYERWVHQFNGVFAGEYRWMSALTLRGSLCLQYHKNNDYRTMTGVFSDTTFPLSFGAGLHWGGFDWDFAFATHEPGLISPNWAILSYGSSAVQAEGSWFSSSLKLSF